MGEVGEREARIDLGELVVRDHRRDRVEAGAKDLDRNRQPVQAELTGLAHQLDRQGAGAVVRRRARLDVGGRKAAHQVAQHAVLLARGVETVRGGRDQAGCGHRAMVAVFSGSRQSAELGAVLGMVHFRCVRSTESSCTLRIRGSWRSRAT